MKSYIADIAVLISTQNGTLGGVAWLQTLCQGFLVQQGDSIGPYCYCNIDASGGSTAISFPSYTYHWDIEVTTHEMGHILGSPHTHRCCWNPPGTGTTPIDGCYAVSGQPGAVMETNPPTVTTCNQPSPATPGSAGGTIMSYCHLVNGVGINFSNGFGTQPGDTIRYMIGHANCGSIFAPALAGVTYDVTATMAKASKTLAANRECLDPSTNITYYWNDNNSAALTDDTLVLMIKKNGNNIGNLDNSTFALSASTLGGYGTGTAQNTTFPSGTAHTLSNNVAMRRYWKINAFQQPTSAVEVIYPFLVTDSSDINGSYPGTALPYSNVYLYKLNSTTISPDPSLNFSGATSGNFNIYTYGTTASTTVWSYSQPSSTNTHLAHILTTNLTGGTGLFASYSSSAVSSVYDNAGIAVYPNPVHNSWVIVVPQLYDQQTVTLQLYTTDGKVSHMQLLQAGYTNNINMSELPTGMYFYRVVAGTNIFTGSIVKD